MLLALVLPMGHQCVCKCVCVRDSPAVIMEKAVVTLRSNPFVACAPAHASDVEIPLSVHPNIYIYMIVLYDSLQPPSFPAGYVVRSAWIKVKGYCGRTACITTPWSTSCRARVFEWAKAIAGSSTALGSIPPFLSPLYVGEALARQMFPEEAHVAPHQQRHERRANASTQVDVPHVQVLLVHWQRRHRGTFRDEEKGTEKKIVRHRCKEENQKR